MTFNRVGRLAGVMLASAVPADGTAADLREAYLRARTVAKTTRRPVVVTCRTHPAAWTEAGAWWEVGAPAYLAGRREYDDAKVRQLRWIGDPSSESEPPDR